ncbi:MAG: beta-lactamase family protein [Chloroflexi bacterium]|nr:beta-lactamase family protein [Chloroflexota bacterium]
MHVPNALDAVLNRYITHDEIAGAQIVVMHRGAVVLEHYVGQANHTMPANVQSIWPLASISKVYAAATIMRLVEQGVLTLNMHATSVLPELQGDLRNEIRVRHLLTHTAGMIYESPQMAERLRAHTSLVDMYAEALTSPLLFAPGTQLSYSDYHWLLLATMAERLTGTPFAELMHQLVLMPMGLTQTFFPTARTPDPAQIAYVRGVLSEGTSGAMYNSDYGRSLAHPAFGVSASARDLARFAWHFMPGGPRVLSEPTVRAMTRDQTAGVPGSYPIISGLGAQPLHAWGLGWALQTAHTPALFSELLSFESFGHHGASGCQVMADPTQELIVVALTNTHLNTGIDRWYVRLQTIAATTIAGVMTQVR